MNNFILRTITGIVFVSLIISSIVFSPLFFAVLFFCITLLGLHEFFKLLQNGGKAPQNGWGLVLGGLSFTGLTAVAHDWMNVRYLLALIPLMMIIFISELYRKKPFPFENIALTLLGTIYIALPFGLLNFFYLPGKSYAFILLLGYFIILWINDTFAYLFGMTFGKHRLFERISPKKSWEGSIGGALTSIIAAGLLAYFTDSLPFIHWIAIAAIIVVSGTLGDLVESMLKRSLNCKDSGTILPGHGGILDRFDAVLISAPLIFVYIQLVN
ncbi:MAG: phosphatidate cytidylyltransferase [Bacillota bacterium]|nr:phosphatidate cytidylyltransferase [Bacillota bacterium]